MSGVNWSERQPNDWLASNGRWYPASQRPRRWNFLALPPAPGHGLAHRLPHAASKQVSANSAYLPPERHTPEGQKRRAEEPPPRNEPSRPPPSPPPTSTAVAPTDRGVADATVTKMSNYKRRIEPGGRPAGALPPPPAQPNPPPPSNPPAPSQASGRVTSSTDDRASVNPIEIAKTALYTGDLGDVLGKARKKIEDAINEAAKPN